MTDRIAKGSHKAFLTIVVVACAALPALAASGVVGSVAGSMNASIGGQALLPNTTIFSGDSLQVQDGVAVIAVGTSNRIVFGRNTAASFLRDANQVTVSLGQGNLTVLHPVDGTPVRVKAQQVFITPAPGLKSVGDIAVLSDSVVITAKEGTLQVENHGVTRSVVKGQTIVIDPNATKDASSGAAVAKSSAPAGPAGATAVAATSAAATGSAAAGAVGAANFTRPGSSRPLNLVGLAATATAITNGSAGCAPPQPGHYPTASIVVPFSGTAAPVCPTGQ